MFILWFILASFTYLSFIWVHQSYKHSTNARGNSNSKSRDPVASLSVISYKDVSVKISQPHDEEYKRNNSEQNSMPIPSPNINSVSSENAIKSDLDDTIDNSYNNNSDCKPKFIVNFKLTDFNLASQSQIASTCSTSPEQDQQQATEFTAGEENEKENDTEMESGCNCDQNVEKIGDHKSDVSQKKNMEERISVYSFFCVSDRFYTDANYNQQIISEFRQFTEFMVHEFSSENLLFLVNFVQFKQFLIQNYFTNESYWVRYRFEYDIKDFINPTKSIENLGKLYDKHMNKQAKQLTNIDNMLEHKHQNCNVLVPFLKKLFYKFIKVSTAPFEVNISYLLRNQTTQHFQSILASNVTINSRTINDKKTPTILSQAMLLNDILPDLISISDECMSLIEFSWMRYAEKRNTVK